MKTVLVRRDAAVPAALRDLVARGSTTLEDCRADELEETTPLEADRIVFWTPQADAAIRAIVQKFAKAEAAARREVLVFVTGEPDPETARSLSPGEVYVWPGDEDRLKMAFLTGA